MNEQTIPREYLQKKILPLHCAGKGRQPGPSRSTFFHSCNQNSRWSKVASILLKKNMVKDLSLLMKWVRSWGDKGGFTSFPAFFVGIVPKSTKYSKVPTREALPILLRVVLTNDLQAS